MESAGVFVDGVSVGVLLSPGVETVAAACFLEKRPMIVNYVRNEEVESDEKLNENENFDRRCSPTVGKQWGTRRGHEESSYRKRQECE